MRWGAGVPTSQGGWGLAAGKWEMLTLDYHKVGISYCLDRLGLS